LSISPASPPASSIQGERAVKVTVLVITYNHSRFIARALDSALSQQTDFDFEIVVSEDCSTDGTREIVLDYQARHPDKMRLILSEQNVHSNFVVRRGITAARGEYVALLDGDDYWTSPNKLQKQVEFLDEHRECSLCFHNAAVIIEDSNEPSRHWTPANQPRLSSFEDIWLGNFIATCTTMLRLNMLGEVPRWYDALFPITDWPLYILCAAHGPLGYIDEVMGAYRLHAGGLYSPYSEWKKLEMTLKFYQTMNANLGFQHDRLARTALSKYFFEWAEEYLQRGDREHGRLCFQNYLQGRAFNKYISIKRLIRLVAKLYLPLLMRTKTKIAADGKRS
jgi:glycosyltransferase involved in cell wall biosynthesis